jgi:hypothetical protein
MSSFRMIRIGLLVSVLILGATLHDKGSTYNTIRVIYVVIVLGLLIGSFALRRGGGMRRRGPGGYGGPTGPTDPAAGRGSFGTAPPPPPGRENPDPEAD